MAKKPQISEREKKRLMKEVLERKKQREKNIEYSKNLQKFSDEKIVKLYLEEYDEYYPDLNHSRDIKFYEKEIKRRGSNVQALKYLKMINLIAFETNNQELIKKLDKKFLTQVQTYLFKVNNPQILIDFYYELLNLKDNNLVSEMNIDVEKFSNGIASSKNIDANLQWLEEGNGNINNMKVVQKSNNMHDLYILTGINNLPKEIYDYCIEEIIKAKDASLCFNLMKNKKTDTQKFRKVILETCDPEYNRLVMTDIPCTKKQLESHKKAMFKSAAEDKFIELAYASIEVPSVFTEEEKDLIIKNNIKIKDLQACRYLLLNENLTKADKAKLQKIVEKKEQKVLNTVKNTKKSEDSVVQL